MSARKKNRKKKQQDGDEGNDTPVIEFEDHRSSMKNSGEGDREVEEAPGAGADGTDDAGAREAGAEPGEVGSAEILDQLQRLQAEFDNYRKRILRERSESWDRAKGDLLLGLLPFLDDVARIADWDESSADAKPLLEGMKLSVAKLMGILREAGFEPIDALGKPFDPNVHEALLTEPVEDPARDDTVGEVLVAGYLFKGMLLRPARVKVLKHVGEADAGEADAGEMDAGEAPPGVQGDADGEAEENAS